MAKKVFQYRGKTLEDLQKMNLKDFAELLPARQRRRIRKGITDQQKIILDKIRKNAKLVETQVRDMVIIPEMVGRMVKVHNGREFIQFEIMPEMIGHCLGEFSLTRKRVTHSAPGVGATRSSASISVK